MENLNNKIKQGKDVLMNLEKEGMYVFHGSPDLIEELEPRQAETFDKEKVEMVKHGEPSVVATPFVEIAIFRAIINSKIKSGNGKHYSEFGCDQDRLYFKTTPGVLESAKNIKGYVYVFKKDDFTKLDSMEWRSDKKLKPIKVFEVSFEDLPDNMQLE